MKPPDVVVTLAIAMATARTTSFAGPWCPVTERGSADAPIHHNAWRPSAPRATQAPWLYGKQPSRPVRETPTCWHQDLAATDRRPRACGYTCGMSPTAHLRAW